MKKTKKKVKKMLISFLSVVIITILYAYIDDTINRYYAKNIESYDIGAIPEYDGKSYVVINNNQPLFADKDYEMPSFEQYSDLDLLGRAGVAFANIGIDLMPTTPRESISMIKPTGFKISKYDFIDGKYLYNRCHLIGYQLTGENANEKNLITCTRSMNTKGMLDFENKVTNYVKKTKKHVLYRVTPIYKGANLLASGVEIEASSVEDKCKDICFHVYVYNVQDGVKIDYHNGNNELIG